MVRVAAYDTWARRPSRARSERHLAAAWEAGPIGLLDEQRRAWASRWADGDIEVARDPELTLGARFALFHLATSCRTTAKVRSGRGV